MILTNILIWTLVTGIAGAIIAVTIDYLTSDTLVSTVVDNISDAQTAQITDIIKNTSSVTASTTVKLNVRCRGGESRDMEITAQKADYFCKNQQFRIHQ